MFHQSRKFYTLLLFSVVALFLIFPSHLYAQKSSGTVPKQYSQAKIYFHNLLSHKTLSQSRRNWLKCVRNFREIYLAFPNHEHTPSVLFMLAGMYHDMYGRFNNPLDLGEAIAYYRDIISLHSKTTLADDALYALGQIYLVDKKDEKRASKIFAKIAAIYADGDMSKAAAEQLEQLRYGKNKELATLVGSLKEAARKGEQPAASAPEAAETGSSPAILQPLRYWSSNDYTRVVIETSSPVQFSSNLLQKSKDHHRRHYLALEKSKDQPRRLYLDLENCKIPSELDASKPINDGLLCRIRSGQHKEKTARVVLDTQSLSEYNIFSLNNPFRIVIDVRGDKQNLTLASFSEPVAATPSLSLPQQLGLGIRKIVIDPGHGGKDPGAIGPHGLKEKDIVLKVAKQTALKIKEQVGCEVILTRSRDIFVPLEERTAIANKNKADLFVSIHVNAAPTKRAKGIETYILSPANTKESMEVAARENATTTRQLSDLQTILLELMQNSKITESYKLAEYVQQSMVSGVGRTYKKFYDLGVKEAPFIVLIGAQMPAILTEIAFISNPTEYQRLRSNRYLSLMANEIVNGVNLYVNDLNLANLKP